MFRHILISASQLREAEKELGTSEDLQKAVQLVKELQEAKRLYRDVRVFCWVLMYPGAHDTQARHIKATWGKRCNKLVFMSTEDDPSVGAIDVGSLEGYTKLWNKTRSALKYIYKNHLEEFEYVLVDNLRYVLQDYDTNEPLYFGQHYKVYGGYNAGGAGHVMGREAVRLFVEKAIPNHQICRPERSKGEDVGMGNCLQRVGVKIGDTRDHLGQGRFWQRHPATVMKDPLGRMKHSRYPVTQGDSPQDCCSSTLISFHKLSVEELYMLDYLIYKVRVFGHIPILPLKAAPPPNLNVVPKKTIEKFREYEDTKLPEYMTETTENDTL
ncbi:Glycoprotein-N-acetylgalactosamine 3-beta-galactosyltransferase 1 [Penaeus vannamei]|uniref:Glycoprotein-N-acetylgalactosamine 3-beta-galactosyltransferase 1 n=1 Tax=Penaeus vannamei TaxID=6689 RepID=A0A3R7MBB3_PENVA|nr:Glycoprotein-N-acetylgalactosamine 3-beta-galactosyltransferase 1 [Penaeus vannamei]